MNNAKILAPRRGLSTTMAESKLVLAEGEIFVEKDATSGVYRIKFGDGSTTYDQLPYALDGEPAGGGLSYGTCNTEANVAAKVVTVSSDQNFKFKTGSTIVVKFTNTNTATNVTLSVNSSTAKSIYYDNAVYTGSDAVVCGKANSSVIYAYNGTNWVWIGHGSDLDTVYDTMTASELTTGTSTTARTVRADYLKSGINTLIDNKSWEGTRAEYDQIDNPDATINYFIVPSTSQV